MIPEIKKILYATDLSKNARYAFSYAASIANRYSAGITILHVLEDISHGYGNFLGTIVGEDLFKEIRNRSTQDFVDTIRRRLDKFYEDVKEELTECQFLVDDIVVKQGHPVKEIMKLAEKISGDLIVMGTHGHGMLEDAMMGSVSRGVVRRSEIPVLTIRLPAD
jgi:nucleotide-binding universal stress UspA family protein